jgi:hypothetical protein
VLQRVGVDGHQPDGGGPFVVLLMEVLVEGRVVEEPGRGGEASGPVTTANQNSGFRPLEVTSAPS